MKLSKDLKSIFFTFETYGGEPKSVWRVSPENGTKIWTVIVGMEY